MMTTLDPEDGAVRLTADEAEAEQDPEAAVVAALPEAAPQAGLTAHKLDTRHKAWIIEQFALGQSVGKAHAAWPAGWPTVTAAALRWYRRRYRAEIGRRRDELANEVATWGPAAKGAHCTSCWPST